MTKKITSGLEDYLEEIYLSQLNNKPMKSAELARKLKISRASVSEAISRLASKNLINYSKFEAISLTEYGNEQAKKIYEKHKILKEFFETVLDVSQDEASENACKIEHIISQNILLKMSKFTKEYKKEEKGL